MVDLSKSFSSWSLRGQNSEARRFLRVGWTRRRELVSAVRRRARETVSEQILCGNPRAREVNPADKVKLVTRDPNLEYGQAPPGGGRNRRGLTPLPGGAVCSTPAEGAHRKYRQQLGLAIYVPVVTKPLAWHGDWGFCDVRPENRCLRRYFGPCISHFPLAGSERTNMQRSYIQ